METRVQRSSVRVETCSWQFYRNSLHGNNVRRYSGDIVADFKRDGRLSKRELLGKRNVTDFSLSSRAVRE